jgi:dihydroorotate dehydrogenase electron transfer subunit
VVKVAGIGTRLLGQIQEGSQVAVLGPLGVPFPLKDLSRHDRVALVAGGIGLAPLQLLSRRLSERGIPADLFYGGRNEQDILKRPEFEKFIGAPRCRYATDDGSLGRMGRVTDILEKSIESGVQYRRVYACGPVPMFKTLAKVLDAARIEGYFALEAEMACGFGVCLGCVAPTVEGSFATVCKEGPCLPYNIIDWEKM